MISNLSDNVSRFIFKTGQKGQENRSLIHVNAPFSDAISMFFSSHEVSEDEVSIRRTRVVERMNQLSNSVLLSQR